MQVALQDQLLLPQAALKSPPIESKNSAICWAFLGLRAALQEHHRQVAQAVGLRRSAVRPPAA